MSSGHRRGKPAPDPPLPPARGHPARPGLPVRRQRSRL